VIYILGKSIFYVLDEVQSDGVCQSTTFERLPDQQWIQNTTMDSQGFWRGVLTRWWLFDVW